MGRMYWQFRSGVHWLLARLGVGRNDGMTIMVVTMFAVGLVAVGCSLLPDFNGELEVISGKHTLTFRASAVEIYRPSSELQVGMTAVSCKPFSLFHSEIEVPILPLSQAEASLTDCGTLEAYGFNVSDMGEGKWTWVNGPRITLSTDTEAIVRWERTPLFQIARFFLIALAFVEVMFLLSYVVWEIDQQRWERGEELKAAFVRGRASVK